MCSLIMPADYEMLVSHSPPASFLAEYRFPRDLYPTMGGCRAAPPCSLALSRPQPPRRPCLVLRTDDSPTEEAHDPSSPTRLKKRVVFADDRGMSLTHVRIMSEPSNHPPVLSLRFLAQVTHGISAEAAHDPWEVKFPQPASDYLDFRRRLDEANVSLENVIVRDSEEAADGTVKVKNLAFEKEVVVRSSADNWKTHEDTFCQFVANSPNILNGCPAYSLYDTFSFRLMLPPTSRRLEFCVCYRSAGAEHWDNNDGHNYVLLKKESPLLLGPPKAPPALRRKPAVVQAKCSDAVQAKLEAWSEFASWNHLETSGPYW